MANSNLNPDARPYYYYAGVNYPAYVLFDPVSSNLNPDALPYHPLVYHPTYVQLYDPVTQHSVFYSLIPPNHPTTLSLRAVSEAEAPPPAEVPPPAEATPPVEAELPPPVEAELPTPTPVEVESQRQYQVEAPPQAEVPPPAGVPPPVEAELPTPTPAKVESPRQYQRERLLSKELRYTSINKIVYVDLQKNRKGDYFHIKDISPSGRDYILLDRSGVDEFHGHINYFVERYTKHLETNKLTEHLFEKRTMTHKKKTYTFTTALLEERLILRIRMVEGNHDHSIAIPVDWSSDHGCAGWSQFGKKLLDVLVEHDITGNHS